MDVLDRVSGHPCLSRIVRRVLQVWPEHEEFLNLRFRGKDTGSLAATEETAQLLWTLAGDEMDDVVESYRRMCEELLKEELFFRRNGRYRYASTRELRDSGFYESPILLHYHRGLLLSQVLWHNHARVIETYLGDFLAACDPAHRLLEVGPGHGLLLALAAQRLEGGLAGWDISESSLSHTAKNLATLGVGEAALALHDIAQGPLDGRYDRVVASELLEHVDNPGEVLRALVGLLEEDGEIFLNVPVNSPAPDHIHLWHSPDDFFGFAQANGVEPRRTYTFPMSGYTREKALRGRFTISCVMIGRRNGAG